jgi:type VI secretion system secreted protein VgrG
VALLQPAAVTDNKDPEKLGRIQLRYLWDLDGRALAWARLVQAGAGKTENGTSYGTHYTPRIGDHVLVGSENGDPSLPIVFGALYHSDHAPDFATENGTEEVLVVRTPNESTIRVLDKKGSEEVVVSMRDNKNLIRLELTQPRITIESVDGTIMVHSKAIHVTADEKLELKAKEIEVSADEDLKVTVGKDKKVSVGGNSEETVTSNKTVKAGKNFKAKAGMKAEMEGGIAVKIKSTEVETSAAATNTIKGALVKIN